MNAHDNPFATRRVEARLPFDPSLVGTDWESLRARWRQLDRRAGIVGPHGAGKSTLLDAVADRLEQPVVRFFFNRDKCQLSSEDELLMEAGAGAVWLADGDGHLGFRDRRCFYKASQRAAGFLSARHQARGLPVLIRLKPDLALAKELLHRLHPTGAGGLEPTLAESFRKRRGNLRHLWLDCYDCLAGR